MSTQSQSVVTTAVHQGLKIHATDAHQEHEDNHENLKYPLVYFIFHTMRCDVWASSNL